MKKISLILVLSLIMCLFASCDFRPNLSQQLISAIKNDDFDTFEKLLAQNPNLDANPYIFNLDRVNMPPLHVACFEGKIELLDADAPADLIIETGFEGWVDCNPQLLVFINGNIKQGADRNHTTIRFNEPGVYNVLVYAYTGMWVDDLLRFKTSLYSVDLKTEKLYYDLKVPFDVLNCTDKNSREYSELLYAINDAISVLDT